MVTLTHWAQDSSVIEQLMRSETVDFALSAEAFARLLCFFAECRLSARYQYVYGDGSEQQR